VNARDTHRSNAALAPRTGAPRSQTGAAFWLVALAGCGPVASSSTPESWPIERLAFVAPARVTLSSRFEVLSEQPLLVAQFELTRGEWRSWYLARAERADPEARARVAAWDPPTYSWPAVFLSLEEGREYARTNGFRLLTTAEWLRTACGSAGAPYPWGANDAASVVNTLELALGQATPVGTFEQGRAPLEIYDLLGNVWEWVDDPPGTHGAYAWAMGGSYLTLRQPLFNPRAGVEGTLHLELDARGRSIDVGLRLCAEARGWLEVHAAELSAAPEAERRLGAVGKRWGSSAIPLLEELLAERPSERAFAWLLAGARR